MDNKLYDYDEIKLLRDGYKKETIEQAESVLAEKLRAVVAKELKQFRRCDLCGKAYKPNNKYDFFCSVNCAKNYSRQPNLPLEDDSKDDQEDSL